MMLRPAVLLVAGFLTPSAGVRSTPVPRVAVSREDFREKLKGKSFEKWSDFKEALGPRARLAPEVGGEVRLTSGLSVAFVIIVNVLIWTLAVFIVSQLRDRERLATWVVFGILCAYGGGVFCYCQWAYEDPGLRVITNFLYGMVPLAVSAACYVLALLVLDLARALTSDGFETTVTSRLKPWEESFGGRLIFFLAVIPGLVTSIHLGKTVSTGFAAAATHFDVLSLCLFVDVGRFFGHFSYLFAREWSIGKSPRAISSRPGLCYVFQALCLAWYVVLARLEAGQSSSVILADRTKIHTLASLTSYVFFPLSLYLAVANLHEFFGIFEEKHACLEVLAIVLAVTGIALFMLLVAVVFDTIEPNLMGIAALLWVVFFSAWRVSSGHVLGYVLALVPLSALAYCCALLSLQNGAAVRGAVLAALAP